MSISPLNLELTEPAPSESEQSPDAMTRPVASAMPCPDEQETSSSGSYLSPSQAKRNQGLNVFLSTFVTIFLAELGDKTQLTTLLMSAESDAPWIVFAGAGSALVLTSLLGVLVGRWLAKRVSTQTIETAAGAVLLVIAVLLLWDIVHL